MNICIQMLLFYTYASDQLHLPFRDPAYFAWGYNFHLNKNGWPQPYPILHSNNHFNPAMVTDASN